jgi:4-alpha-glucanotransferase
VIRRSGGLLLHVTSLPSGRLGSDARDFVDYCNEAGQRWWQVLPVAPPGPARCPYAALSAFAGGEHLLERGARPDLDGFEEFRRAQKHWLEDYALYRALRDRFRRPWIRWPRPLRDRDPDALATARADLVGLIRRYERKQYAFHRQWLDLRGYARRAGVRLVGDIPFFVALDSADVWADRELFRLGATGRPSIVTGVPPDYFSADGQRWDNPHYDWAVHRRRRYRWWIARLRRMFELFDAVRIDHFLGLLRAWEIPARAKTARRGRWGEGPGARLLAEVKRSLGPVTLLAEDLGLVTPEATALRSRFRMPGMRVLQFSFGDDDAQRPHHFPRRCVVYTGTHDNNTTVGWYREGGPDRERARRYAACRPNAIHWGLIRVAQQSVADLAITPVQDLLGLGAEARMNRPGTARGNWRWRLAPNMLRRAAARRLARIAGDAGR